MRTHKVNFIFALITNLTIWLNEYQLWNSCRRTILGNLISQIISNVVSLMVIECSTPSAVLKEISIPSNPSCGTLISDLIIQIIPTPVNSIFLEYFML